MIKNCVAMKPCYGARARIIFKKFKMAFCFNDLANDLFDSLK